MSVPYARPGRLARIWRVAAASFPEVQSSRRLAGIDVARALAMLGMLVEHMLQYPTVQPKGVLWSVYGRSAPLFVLLAGVGLSLAARTGRPLDRASIAARAPLLLLIGMALSLEGDGVILQSFALFFVVGVATVRLSRWALTSAAITCLIGGPLFLTELRRHEVLHFFGWSSDVGFGALVDPVPFVRGLLLSYYPAVIWLGFFFVGMLLGRGDISSATAGRRIFGRAGAASVVLFSVGWAGARAFAPPVDGFSVAPPPPTMWSQHWTTYGFSNSIGWALSSTALALAITGGCIWVSAFVGRSAPLLRPLVALGAMPLSFYVLHFLYLGTLWEAVQPHLSTTISYCLASIVVWLAFAVLAAGWLSRFRRGPLETVLHATVLLLTLPWRTRRSAGPGTPRVLQRTTPRA